MRTVRREFLQVAGMAAAGVGLAKPSSAFRYALCNESMRGMKWEEQCAVVAEAGYEGVELAPFTLVQQDIGELTQDVRRAMVAALRHHRLECTGLHWLLAPPPAGLHCTSPDAQVRRKTWDYVASLIDLCADLGGPVMVFGSPKQRSALGVPVPEAVRHFREGLAEAADHAQKRGVSILVEALDHTQTDVINTMAEAVAVVKEVNHPNIQTLFDFHNTLDEKRPLEELIRQYYSFICHVHVQEMDGKYLGAGAGATDYVPAFQALKDLGYRRWVSVEVFDFSPGPPKIAAESMRTLRAIEARLT